PPAPPEGAGNTDGSLQAYVYPGSSKTMDVTSHGKGVMQLTTNDPVDKVRDWYRARLRPSTTVDIPFTGGTIMKGKDAKAIITSNGSGTVIVLTKGDD